jgi:uncharacterized protein YjbI with pentapeptide repeats
MSPLTMMRFPIAGVVVAVALVAAGTPVAAVECSLAPGAQCAGVNIGGEDLSNARLDRINLRGANASDAVLTDARLMRADLRGADLSNAYLDGADLTRAHLRGASLFGAYLSRTKLVAANLTDVDLRSVQFDAANRRAQLREINRARLCNTTLPNGTVSNRDCKAPGR